MKGIIFDLDNTITDRRQSITAFARRFARDFSFQLRPIPFHELENLLQNGDHLGFKPKPEMFKEMERVFDICHGCRRCFNLCDSFPRLFDLVDESNRVNWTPFPAPTQLDEVPRNAGPARLVGRDPDRAGDRERIHDLRTDRVHGVRAATGECRSRRCAGR